MSTPATQPTGRLRPQSLAESIVEVLQREIIAGAFPAGQRLVERELSERFGVSSIPVREALREMENRGLVMRRHNHGCSVIELTPTEVSRIAELRYTLEPQVAGWAAARITREGVSKLQTQLERMRAAAADNDLSSFFQEDIAFHRLVWQAAENAFAARALESVLGSLFASGMIGSEARSSIDLNIEMHKHARLLKAIEDHDVNGASEVLRLIAAGFETRLPKAVRGTFQGR